MTESEIRLKSCGTLSRQKLALPEKSSSSLGKIQQV